MTAAAGGGKSRVRHEFCDRIQRHGRTYELLVGRGDPMRDAAPFALLGPALLAAAGITGAEPSQCNASACWRTPRASCRPRTFRASPPFSAKWPSCHFPTKICCPCARPDETRA